MRGERERDDKSEDKGAQESITLAAPFLKMFRKWWKEITHAACFFTSYSQHFPVDR